MATPLALEAKARQRPRNCMPLPRTRRRPPATTHSKVSGRPPETAPNLIASLLPMNPFFAAGAPTRRVLRCGECSDAAGAPTLANTREAHEYKRRSRIQEKLANTEEARECRRSSRIQEKLANTEEAREYKRSSRMQHSFPHRAEAPTASRSPGVHTGNPELRR